MKPRRETLVESATQLAVSFGFLKADLAKAIGDDLSRLLRKLGRPVLALELGELFYATSDRIGERTCDLADELDALRRELDEEYERGGRPWQL